jgi:hypothetical protein
MCNPDDITPDERERQISEMYDSYLSQEYQKYCEAWGRYYDQYKDYIEVEPPQINSEINITIKGM